MKNKKPKIVISNPAVNANNLKEALNFKSKKVITKYKFLDVVLGLYPRSLVISWAVKNVGFGEVSFYLQDGEIKVDTEGMGSDFVGQLVREVYKKYKKQTLKINQGDNLVPRFLEALLEETKINKNKS